MTTRTIKFIDQLAVLPYPICGNKTIFTANSDYCAEDCCEIWLQCLCGHAPDSDYRFEDVWGSVHDENVMAALSCWNDYVLEKSK